ncbi:hypothetical protein [Streptomyces sp. UG1]|uniref:hypothetical protein n=1 Tax=Streptomyces sp. UG1 TaxID=3417652 RepID=UPI003CF8AF7E
MTNATAPRSPGVKMTMRVYTVTRDGIIKSDSGTREILAAQELPDVQHQAGQTAVTR